jgi:hypothetical protein
MHQKHRDYDIFATMSSSTFVADVRSELTRPGSHNDARVGAYQKNKR